MSSAESHIQALRDVLIADHEALIAEELRYADEARATGDDVRYRRLTERVERLKAMKYPGDTPAA